MTVSVMSVNGMYFDLRAYFIWKNIYFNTNQWVQTMHNIMCFFFWKQKVFGLQSQISEKKSVISLSQQSIEQNSQTVETMSQQTMSQQTMSQQPYNTESIANS